jgi:hypothetical protein
MIQPDLFTANIEPPYVRGSDTSKAAAESMIVSAASLRGRILALIAEIVWARGGGWTCDEVEIFTGLKHQTVSARIRELCQLNIIKDSGRRRKTRSNRDARVYVVVA